MTEHSPTHLHPDDSPQVAEIKKATDDLIALVREYASGSSQGERRAALAATHYEMAAMWAEKSIFS